jgi:hypothetical protein
VSVAREQAVDERDLVNEKHPEDEARQAGRKSPARAAHTLATGQKLQMV